MTSAPEKTAMAAKLTPARQNAILSHCDWNADGTVNLTCHHRSAPLLRLAGVRAPRPLQTYAVPVIRDRSGFLIIARFHSQRPQPQSDPLLDLFAPGGLFAGEPDPDSLTPAQAAAEVAHITHLLRVS